MTHRTDSAEAVWNAVLDSYDEDGLITLTNIRDRSATLISDSVGNNAALAVVDLWTVYAQQEFDPDDHASVEVAKRGVIAVLWSRGGTSSSIAKIEWDEVFGDSGMIAKLRNTTSRARVAPSTNSGVQRSEETVNGRSVRPWSDRDALPHGFSPSRRIADNYNLGD